MHADGSGPRHPSRVTFDADTRRDVTLRLVPPKQRVIAMAIEHWTRFAKAVAWARCLEG
jgi:hypothetical protein